VPTVQWAVEHGCGWGTWSCAQLLPEHYICANGDHTAEGCKGWCPKTNAELLSAWAHEHGCPCTCAADADAAAVAAAQQAAATAQLVQVIGEAVAGALGDAVAAALAEAVQQLHDDQE
jgi:hypothetical protein